MSGTNEQGSQTTPENEGGIVVPGDLFNMEPTPEQPGPVESSPLPAAPDKEGRDNQSDGGKKPDKPEHSEDDLNKDFRFKTHDEAEEGYKSQQGHITKIEQENAKLKEDAKARDDAEKAEKERKTREAAIYEYSIGRNEEALKEIGDLDPEDEDHQKKVAEIWARATGDTRQFEPEIESITPSDDDGKSIPASADNGNTSPADAGNGAGTDSDIIKYVDDTAVAAGIDPGDLTFQHYAGIAPVSDQDGKAMTLKDQVQWAIEETKKHEATKRTKILSEAEIPLSRSGIGRVSGGKEETKPVSMDAALSEIEEDRRL